MKTDHGGGESLGTIPFAFLPQQKDLKEERKQKFGIISEYYTDYLFWFLQCEQFVKLVFYRHHIGMGMI